MKEGDTINIGIIKGKIVEISKPIGFNRQSTVYIKCSVGLEELEKALNDGNLNSKSIRRTTGKKKKNTRRKD